MFLSWPLLFLQVALAAKTVHHGKSSKVWHVYDFGSNETSPHHGDHHPPSCLIATLDMSLVVPYQIPGGLLKNKTIDIPNSAELSGSCGDTQESMVFTWNNTLDGRRYEGNLIMYFEKQEHAIYLTDVWTKLILVLDHGDESVLDNTKEMSLIASLNDAQALYTPLHFAHYCASRTEIALTASTGPIRFDSGTINPDPVVDKSTFLVFHHLKIEAFRVRNRFTDHFTHLKWDCQHPWIFSTAPKVVRITLAILFCGFIAVIVLRIRYRKKQARRNLAG